MANFIYIAKFGNHFETNGINICEWQKCANEIENLRLIKNDNYTDFALETFSPEFNEYTPVFWIEKTGIGYMKDKPFFTHEHTFIKGIEIAVKLNASIYTQELELIYMQNYGPINSPLKSINNPPLLVDDLVLHKITFRDNYIESIEKVIQIKKENSRRNSKPDLLAIEKLMARHIKKWWQFWK
ncbi:MAG: hypothetical protein ACPGLV_11150 [Bacteroidia bacterium]